MRTLVNQFSASGRVAESDEVADAIALLRSHSARGAYRQWRRLHPRLLTAVG